MLIEKRNSDHVSPAGVLNRGQRRRLERVARKQDKTLHPVVGLMPESKILEREDDLSLLKIEVEQYKLAQSYTSDQIRIYKSFLSIGITEATCKKSIIAVDFVDMEEFAEVLLSEIKSKDQGLIRHILKTAGWILNPRREIIYDPDEDDLISQLAADDKIKGLEILEEVKRARNNSIELMEMQIDWLKQKQAPQPKEKEEIKKTDNVEKTNQLPKVEEELSPVVFQNISEKLPETQTNLKQEEIEQEFLLKGWELLFSESTRVSDTRDLINVPTNSRQDTLDAVAKLTRRIVSVKPNTILRALEFYLKKDVIQKALASRIKHAKDKWIKITRGGYRILLLIPDPDKERAIFFVDARSSSYEHL